jgi:hypothetical protein
MNLQLDLQSVALMSSRVVVPTGNYPVRITKSELKETKAKGGYYIEVDFTIQAGEHKGTAISDRLNIHNSNQDTVRIALQKLKTIATVGGHKNPNFVGDTSELLNLGLNIYVEENETSFTGKDGTEVETTENTIKAFYEYSEEALSSSPKKEKASAKTVEAPAPWSPPFEQNAAPTAPPVQAPAAPAAPAPAPSAAPAASAFPWMQS